MIIPYLTRDENHKKGSGWGSDAPDKLSQSISTTTLRAAQPSL